ncbi:MAG: hypothetical protein ABEI07_00440 [Candidatus Nanohaloarchaea archaeon]
MARRCDFCGAVLDEEEEGHSDLLGKDVCEDCLHGGVELLRKVLDQET